jgi:type IV pilus assembly protein PilA
MRATQGFSLIELLVVIAIILIISALATPMIVRSRIAADESAAAANIRTLNTAQISYYSAYPTVGYAASLTVLGGTSCNPPSSSSACLIDTVLAAGTNTGYSFTLPPASLVGTPPAAYQFIATPILFDYYGMRYFCSFEDATVRVSSTAITTCDTTVSPLD